MTTVAYTDTQNNICLHAALDYLNRGWSVIPLCPPDHEGCTPGHMEACTRPGKSVRVEWKEYQGRLPRESEIQLWWSQCPTGNVGITLGGITRLIGLDVDSEYGHELLMKMSGGDLPDTLQFKTSGGYRLLYRLPPGHPSRPISYKDEDGQEALRILGTGSQTVMPPSMHPSGHCYEWVLMCGPDEIEPAPAPKWLLDLLKPVASKPTPKTHTQPPATNAVHRAQKYLAACDPAVSGQGGHTQTLLVAIHLVRGFCLDEDTALSLMLSDYNPRCLPPWDEKELLHKVQEAAKAYLKDGKQDGYLLSEPHKNGVPNASGNGHVNYTTGAHAKAENVPPPKDLPPKPDASKNDSSAQGPSGGGIIWKPLPISKLKRIAVPDTWVWKGILAPGKVTLLTAEAKAGKTTLLSLLYERMTNGGSLCGSQVYPGRVVVVSEEPSDLWLDRKERLGLGDHVEVLPMPFVTKPTQKDWELMLRQAVQSLQQQPAQLVVLDTISHLWWLDDENDNAKQAAALMPLRQLCAGGAAVCLVHHFGAEKSGPRGGTELRGFPDLLAELHLYRPNDFIDRRRTVKVRGRLTLAPFELVIELNDDADDYEVIGGVESAGKHDIWATLKDIVPAGEPGLSAKEFVSNWPTETPPAVKRVNEAIAEKWQGAGWQRSGNGKKNDPYCYWWPDPEE